MSGKRPLKCKSVAERKFPIHQATIAGNIDKLRPKHSYLVDSIDLQISENLSLIDIRYFAIQDKFELLVRGKTAKGYSRCWMDPSALDHEIEDDVNLLFKLLEDYLVNFQKLVDTQPKVHYFFEDKKKLVNICLEKVRYAKWLEENPGHNQVSEMEGVSAFTEKYGGEVANFMKSKQARFKKFLHGFCKEKLKFLETKFKGGQEYYHRIDFIDIMQELRQKLQDKYKSDVYNDPQKKLKTD